MWRAAIMTIGLFGCTAAGPGFRGIDPVAHSVEGSRFVVRSAPPIAEVIRTSPEALPRFDIVAERAAMAVASQTRCLPAWVMGDPAMMLVGMSCDGAKPPKMPKRRASFTCDLWRTYATQDVELDDLTLECFRP